MKFRYGRLHQSSVTHPDADTLRSEALVSSAWLSAAAAENVVIIECNEESHHYAAGHIPGAWYLDWRRDLREPDSGSLIRGITFERLAGSMGITPDTTVVFYGD